MTVLLLAALLLVGLTLGLAASTGHWGWFWAGVGVYGYLTIAAVVSGRTHARRRRSGD